MDTKALKQKILDLAIRGKLVPQDPNDEPASVLLEKIRAEKMQMVKDGKLKSKDLKNDTVIFVGEDNLHYEKFSDGTVICIENEIPFELPSAWQWARLGTVTINRDGERKPVSLRERADVKKLYDYYGASGIIDKIDNYIFAERLLLVGEDGANLVTRTKPIAFFANGKYWVNNHAHCIDATDKSILDFICLYINAINLEQYVTGSAQPKLTQENLNRILIPIPSKAEQKLISSIKSSLFSYIDSIDNNKSELTTLIKQVKTKILDLAIRGKLVHQDPSDEPASVLLERIRQEKEELIKAGKLKRDKRESVIFLGEDNSYYEKFSDGTIKCIQEDIPFKLPPGWEWCRLKSICSVLTDGTHQTPIYSDCGYVFLSSKNVKDGRIDWDNVMFIPENLHRELYTRLTPKLNDILLAKNGTTGVAAIVDRDCVFDIYVSLALIRIVNEIVSPRYILNAIGSYYVQNFFKKSLKGIGVPNLHLERVRETLLPIPPFNEQKRITYQIEKLLTQVTKISNALK